MQLDAHVPQLLLDGLCDILAYGESSLRHERELEPNVVLRAYAAGRGAPAGTVEQRSRTDGIEPVHRNVRFVCPREWLNGSVHYRHESVENCPDEQLAVDGVRDGPSHRDVGKWWEVPLVERDMLIAVPKHLIQP